MRELFEELEKKTGYRFKDRHLLHQAMTHSSYSNERHWDKLECNERLEFLGDAVLELVSSDFLYHKYPDRKEGELTKLRASMVCEPSLAYCAKDLSLEKYLLLGKGEEATGGRNRPSIISDAMEALIGAIYLKPGGYQRFSQIGRALADISYEPWEGVDAAGAAALAEGGRTPPTRSRLWSTPWCSPP